MKRAAAILLFAALAPAQSIAPPVAGVIRDAANRVRRVLGVAANFLVSPDAGPAVLGFAFSGRKALVKTVAELVTLSDGGEIVERVPAPPGSALFAFDAKGEPALAWFPQTREMWRLGPSRHAVPLAFDAEVVSLSLAEDGGIRVNRAGLDLPETPVRVQQMSERLFHVLLEDGTSRAVRSDTREVYILGPPQ